MTKSDDPSRVSTDPEAFKQFEQAGWSEVGGVYAGHFGPLTSQAADALLGAAAVRASSRVLDVACGPGYLAAAAARRGAVPLGIDFSSSMVAAARRLSPTLEFREGDAEALPVSDASFDAVVIGFGMLHFARPEQAIAEAFRVLVPGGRIAFSVWDAPERARALGIVREAIEAKGSLDVGLPPGPDFFRFADAAESRAVLDSAGFVPAPVVTLPLVWRVASADALIDAFMEAGVRTRGLLRAQSPAALEVIRAQVRRAAAPFQQAGWLEIPTPCVICSGVKPGGHDRG